MNSLTNSHTFVTHLCYPFLRERFIRERGGEGELEVRAGMELRVCPTCLALFHEGHEHETVMITVDYETKTVRQPDKASAQRWAEKKISQLKANLESIERDFERLVKAVERTRRMLGVEK